VAAQVDRLIEHVQYARFDEAIAALEQLATYLPESVAREIVDVFLMGIEWHGTKLPGTPERLAKLERAFTDLSRNSHPIKRDFGRAVLGRRHQLEGHADDALAFYQQIIDGGERALESFALEEGARTCRQRDPERAIRYFELYRSRYGKSTGAEGALLELGDLYIAQGEHAKALEVYQSVETQRTRGVLLLKGIDLTPRRGMMRSLQGLGRQDEAQSLARQLLKETQHGTPLEKLADPELMVGLECLKVLGMTEDAARYEREITRRRIGQ